MIIRNNLIPFKGFAAINICGVIFVRNGVVVSNRLLNHERIHTRQMLEMLVVVFYLWYLVEWAVKLFRYGRMSYYHISFEREAYRNELDYSYPEKRKLFSWLKYI